MGFNKYDTLNILNDSTTDWTIRVRAQSIWKGITRKTGDFRGYNIIFFDDSKERIHAFISSQICPRVEKELMEGQIYIVKNFTVKKYIGDETNRAIRNEKHIFFTSETKLTKDLDPGLMIPDYSFDFYNLEDMRGMKDDNRFLTDVVAVILDVQPKAQYTKESGEKSHVQFTITNGKKTMNVTFFNEFGDCFLKAKEKVVDEPVIIIIASAKVTEWKDVLYLTNFPSTRFYLNTNHHTVNLLRQRLGEPNFYDMDIDDKVEDSPCVKVVDIKKLSDDYIEKIVSCQLTVRKVDERMNWYVHFCTNYDKDLKLVDGEYKCCNRIYPYTDKRYFF